MDLLFGVIAVVAMVIGLMKKDWEAAIVFILGLALSMFFWSYSVEKHDSYAVSSLGDTVFSDPTV